MKKSGKGKLRNEKTSDEQRAENPALDNWMWILRARAAARQAVDGAAPPAAPLRDVEPGQQSSPPE